MSGMMGIKYLPCTPLIENSPKTFSPFTGVHINNITKKMTRIELIKVIQIIQPRMEEIFELVSQELKMSGTEGKIASGVVVTGGAALIPGIEEVVEKVLKLPVRVGYPQGIGGLVETANSPIYSTAVGLALYGAKAKSSGKSGLRLSTQGGLDNFFSKVKRWFVEFF